MSQAQLTCVAVFRRRNPCSYHCLASKLLVWRFTRSTRLYACDLNRLPVAGYVRRMSML